MRKIKLFYIFIILIPTIIYSILGVFVKNSILSFSVSLSSAVIIFFIIFYFFKKIEYIIIIELCIITVLSIISFFCKNDLYFKLKPAFIESLLLIFIIILGFSNKFFKILITKYFKMEKITYNNMIKYQIYIFSVSPILIIHIPLIIISAVLFSHIIWAFISSVLLYLLLAIFIVSLFVSNKIRNIYIKKKYKDDEWFDILDDKCRKIGTAPRIICHNGSKLLHPVVHVHIINYRGEILLQKRSLNKKIQPGKWDTSVGGHIAAGEKLEEALKREVMEEAGIDIDLSKTVPLNKYIFESSVEKEYVFSFIYNYNGKIIHQESEIDEVKFFKLDEISKMIDQNMITENFVKEYSFLLKILKNGWG